MSHTRVKTTYSIQGFYGGTDKAELYCDHNHTSGTSIFYNADGTITTMVFSEFIPGDDLWDAMNLLMFPFKDEWGGTLKEGVEYYSPEQLSGYSTFKTDATAGTMRKSRN